MSKMLFKLEDISPVRTWDYSLPTLTIEKRSTEYEALTSIKSFRKALLARFPVLYLVDLDNLAVMGGSVLSVLTNNFGTVGLDLFVITDKGNTKEGKEFTLARIQRFIDEIYTFMFQYNKAQKLQIQEKNAEHKNFDLELFRVRRIRSAFKLEVPVLKLRSQRRQSSRATHTIQIFTTPYKNLSSLLQHADLDCTALAFYENELWISERAKFGVENLSIVVDGEKYSPAHIDRVIKYFKRGFDIILPSLDVSKIRTENFAFGSPEVLDLPQFAAVVTQVQDNKIFVKELKHPREVAVEVEGIDHASPFENYNEARIGLYLSSEEIADTNMVSLINNKYDDFIMHGQGANYANVYRPWPQITESLLVDMYERVKSSILSKGCFDVRKLVKYFTVMPPTALIEKVLVSFVARKEPQSNTSSSISNINFKVHLRKVMDELVASQVATAKEKLQQLESIKLTSTNDLGGYDETCTPDEILEKCLVNFHKRRRFE